MCKKIFNNNTKIATESLFLEKLETFWWNPFHFILNGSKDIVCWKMYNFLGHPVHSSKSFSQYKCNGGVQAQTDNHDMRDFITARATISRYMLSLCHCLSVCHRWNISTFREISRYFPTTEIHLPAKGGLLSGCWFQQREMQSLICFNTVSGPPIAFI